jgi:hypothetical protein
MPDFIGVLGDFLDRFRQTIVCVRKNNNPQRPLVSVIIVCQNRV